MFRLFIVKINKKKYKTHSSFLSKCTLFCIGYLYAHTYTYASRKYPLVRILIKINIWKAQIEVCVYLVVTFSVSITTPERFLIVPSFTVGTIDFFFFPSNYSYQKRITIMTPTDILFNLKIKKVDGIQVLPNQTTFNLCGSINNFIDLQRKKIWIRVLRKSGVVIQK